MISDKDFYSVSDNAHFLGGAVAVLGAAVLHVFNPWYAFFGILLFAGLKEGLWDPKEESVEVAGSGVRDFLGYAVGASVAMALVYFKALISWL